MPPAAWPVPKPGAALAGTAGQRRQRRVHEDQPGAKSAAAPAVVDLTGSATASAAHVVAHAAERADHAQRETALSPGLDAAASADPARTHPRGATGGDGASVPHDVFDDAVNAAMDARAALGDLHRRNWCGKPGRPLLRQGRYALPTMHRCRQCTAADSAPPARPR